MGRLPSGRHHARPGVYIIPEVGDYDYMADIAGNDQGYQWYAGAKRPINFQVDSFTASKPHARRQ